MPFSEYMNFNKASLCACQLAGFTLLQRTYCIQYMIFEIWKYLGSNVTSVTKNSSHIYYCTYTIVNVWRIFLNRRYSCNLRKSIRKLIFMSKGWMYSVYVIQLLKSFSFLVFVVIRLLALLRLSTLLKLSMCEIHINAMCK